MVSLIFKSKIKKLDLEHTCVLIIDKKWDKKPWRVLSLLRGSGPCWRDAWRGSWGCRRGRWGAPPPAHQLKSQTVTVTVGAVPDPDTIMSLDPYPRREIITVRGQSYVSRLPKYWPPTPLSAGRVCTPRLCCWGGGGGGRIHSPGGEGVGGQYFGRRET